MGSRKFDFKKFRETFYGTCYDMFEIPLISGLLKIAFSEGIEEKLDKVNKLIIYIFIDSKIVGIGEDLVNSNLASTIKSLKKFLRFS